MVKQWTMVTSGLAIGIMLLVTAPTQSQAVATSKLTAQDYIDIQQLVLRYPYAVDSGVDNGEMYAGLFAPDGVFVQRTGEVRGKDALAAVARRFQRGRNSTFHFLMDHVVEPSPEGATGKEYLAQFVFGDKGEPSRIFGGGHYDDVYEKTASGWRFKRRQFIPSQGGLAPTTPTAAFGPLVKLSTASPKGAPLSAADYLEIQQLISRYPYGLDTGGDHGSLYASVFAPDGVFMGGNNKIVGREKLIAFASGHRPGQGPLYVRNFSTNVIISPSPEGAVGKISTTVLDIGEGTGKPSSVLNGGHYEDAYVRTADGWRIKSRQFTLSQAGDQPTAFAPIAVPARVAGASPSKSTAKAARLTPEDYVEIQQVVARYPVALDTGAGDGYVYADLFAPDGSFVVGAKKFEGREILKNFAWHHRPGQGPLYVRNFSTGAMIEPSPDGATGRVNAVVLELGEGGKPSSVLEGGHYEDIYVRTAMGWRIKRREFIYSKTELPVPPASTAAR